MGKTRNNKIFKALGLMSGTSLDGVDAAVIKTDGENIYAFGKTAFIAFDNSERAVLMDAIKRAAKWAFDGDVPDFRMAEHVLHQAHIKAARKIMAKNTDIENTDIENIDIIGFHGQTLLHQQPKNGQNGKSLQIGNAKKLANDLGVNVVYDFRSNDIENGGQGAPLAPVYHRALVKMQALELPVCIINIGGVANMTLVCEDELYATDCGSGNAVLDDWVRQNALGDYDKGGRLAMSGLPDIDLVEKWLRRDFFRQNPPKSADRNDFNVLNDLSGFAVADGAASLAIFTARAIAKTIKQYRRKPKSLIICGGGRKNRAIMAGLAEQGFGTPINADDLGWNGDALEAQAFGFLAVRRLLNLPISYPQTTGVDKARPGGVLFSPQSL